MAIAAAGGSLIVGAARQQFGPLSGALLGAALLLGTLYGFVHRRRIGRSVRLAVQRGTLSSTIYVASIAGSVLLLNYLSYRHHHQWDLTRSHTWSLAPQSKGVLARLGTDVTVTAYIPQVAGIQTSTGNRVVNPTYAMVSDLLEQYASYSSRVHSRMIDPDTQRDLVPASVAPPVIVFHPQTGEDVQLSASFEEKDLTGAFLQIEKGRTRSLVCFLTGEGENPLDSPPASPHSAGPATAPFVPTALSTFKRLLDQEQYQVLSLDLSAGEKIPAGCDLLVLAGAQQGLQPGVGQQVNAYLDSGGNLLVLSDAPSARSPSAGLDSLLSRYGIEMGAATIIGNGRVTGSPLMTLGGSFASDSVTRGLRSSHHLILIQARPVIVKHTAHVRVKILARSDLDTWGETNIETEQTLDSRDQPGPLPIAASGIRLIPGAIRRLSRVVVIGSVSMATDETLGPLLGRASRPNLHFLSNAVNWLTSNEELLDMPPPPQPARITPPTAEQTRAVTWALAVGTPLLLLFIGSVVYWRHR